MGKLYGIPETIYGWLSLILGITGSILWGTQHVLDWFGTTEGDKSLYSIVVLLVMLTAIGCTWVARSKMKANKELKHTEGMTVIRIVILGMVFIILLLIIKNGVGMTLDTNFNTYANSNLGFFTGFRQLTSITTEDVNSLQNFALGIKQIVRAMFLVVPCLIATWGGLSVLTADSIDEAEGGILAVVAAFIVFIVVWVFKAIDISLMQLTWVIWVRPPVLGLSSLTAPAINALSNLPIALALA